MQTSNLNHMKHLRILVTGASGFIGGNIIHNLVQQGHSVVACARNPQNLKKLSPNIEAIQADFTKDLTPEVWIPRLENIDVVINAVGIISEQRGQTFNTLHQQAPIALFTACVCAGVKRVIQISALGVDGDIDTGYFHSKRAADNFLDNSGLDWVIVMPSLVYGSGGKSFAVFKALSSLPVISLINHGQQTVQPIYIDDLADLISKLVQTTAVNHERVTAVGPNAMSYKDMLLTYRTWLGYGKVVLLSVPSSIALMFASLMRILGNAYITPDNIRMLLQCNAGDSTGITTILGRPPRSLENVFYQTPARQNDGWHANLYFIRPLLRISLAFVWIAAGMTSIFFYPVELSYQMLSAIGLSGDIATIALYGAATLDLMLGFAMLFSFRLVMVGIIQIATILVYTLIITLYLPEFWAHPFGHVSKNLPIIVTTLMMMAMEQRAAWNT